MGASAQHLLEDFARLGVAAVLVQGLDEPEGAEVERRLGLAEVVGLDVTEQVRSLFEIALDRVEVTKIDLPGASASTDLGGDGLCAVMIEIGDHDRRARPLDVGDDVLDGTRLDIRRRRWPAGLAMRGLSVRPFAGLAVRTREENEALLAAWRSFDQMADAVS